MVACRSRGAAPTRCQATASAIAALGPLADVAVDGGRQTLPSLTPNLCLSRLIQESSGFWYRFQLLRPESGLAWLQIRGGNDQNASGKAGASFITPDSPQGRRLGSYSCRPTLLQLFVSGRGIDLTVKFFLVSLMNSPQYCLPTNFPCYRYSALLLEI